MGRLTTRIWLIALLVPLLALPTAAAAREGGGDPKSKKKAKAGRWTRSAETETGWVQPDYFVDERTGKRLLQASEAISDEDWDKAEKALDKLRMRNLNPLEKSKVYNMRAYIENGRDNPAGARDYLAKAIGEKVLSPEDTSRLRLQIAQLWFAEDNWTEGAKALEYWLTVAPDPQPGHFYMLALAYYQLEDYEKALVPAQQALTRSDDPREGWLQLLLSLRLTLKQYEEAIPILEELVVRYPKKTYWMSLSTVHGAVGNYEEALVPLQLAYTQGLLTEGSELQRLAQLMLFLDLPYRSAQILQQGLDEGTIASEARAWETLSNSWIGAREYEKAAVPLERAAQLSEDGDLYIRLAQVHIQREKWADAQRALRLGVDKGLKNPGDAYVLMGIVLHRQQRPAKARAWFARALKQKDTKDEATTWIAFIDREIASR